MLHMLQDFMHPGTEEATRGIKMILQRAWMAVYRKAEIGHGKRHGIIFMVFRNEEFSFKICEEGALSL